MNVYPDLTRGKSKHGQSTERQNDRKGRFNKNIQGYRKVYIKEKSNYDLYQYNRYPDLWIQVYRTPPGEDIRVRFLKNDAVYAEGTYEDWNHIREEVGK